MTLDETIIRAEEIAERCAVTDGYYKTCELEHRQLAEWLKELKELKDKNTPKELVKDYDGGYKSGWLRCPSCFYILGGFNERTGVVAINHNANNCLSCGQAINKAL